MNGWYHSSSHRFTPQGDFVNDPAIDPMTRRDPIAPSPDPRRLAGPPDDLMDPVPVSGPTSGYGQIQFGPLEMRRTRASA